MGGRHALHSSAAGWVGGEDGAAAPVFLLSSTCTALAISKAPAPIDAKLKSANAAVSSVVSPDRTALAVTAARCAT